MIYQLRLLAVLVTLPGVYSIHAQREADTWITGYSTSLVTPEFGLAFWNFDSLYPLLDYDLEVNFLLAETNASISSSTNQPLLITNGMQVKSGEGEDIIDTISYLDGGENWNFYYRDDLNAPWGFKKMQTSTILPVPGSTNEYSVLYYHAITEVQTLYFVNVAVLEARVRLEENGSWTILYKDGEVLKRTNFLSEGTWHAVRHANGRDWWMLMHDWEGETYYRLLVDPTGPHLDGTQEYEEALSIGRAWFSQDGAKYARYLSVTYELSILYIYDFDRCTGMLSNQIVIPVHGKLGGFQGIAFSPDSRYLFMGYDRRAIYQFDLHAPDIEASQMLVDTFDGYIEPNWFQTDFGPMMPGPDGRIYMFPTTGSSRAVHVIDRPNERGKAAKLLQHHLMLQTSNARSVQNFPNFRLGPIDGSPCDTLGLDNHPQSRWRHEIEDADPLEIRFTDLSFFRPEVWSWDFGDGEISSEQNPIHTYPTPGLNYACLIVSNEYSSDTSCQWIEIKSVSTNDSEEINEKYIVYPNPFSDYIAISPLDDSFAYHSLSVTLTDIHGRSVAHLEMTCPCRLKLSSLPPGVYFYTLHEDGHVVGSGKMVK